MFILVRLLLGSMIVVLLLPAIASMTVLCREMGSLLRNYPSSRVACLHLLFLGRAPKLHTCFVCIFFNRKTQKSFNIEYIKKESYNFCGNCYHHASFFTFRDLRQKFATGPTIKYPQFQPFVYETQSLLSQFEMVILNKFHIVIKELWIFYQWSILSPVTSFYHQSL